MRRAIPLLLALVVLAAACTGGPVDPVPTGSLPSPAEKDVPRPRIAFVGSFDDPRHAASLQAARLAAAEIDSGSAPIALDLVVTDYEGDLAAAASAVTAAAAESVAVVYAGPGHVLAGLRPRLEPTRVPVVLLDGDLYTARALYSNVFQASVPLLWQARIVAKYLRVRDEPTARVVHDASEPRVSRAAWDSAALEEGIETTDDPAAPLVRLGVPAEETDPGDAQLLGTMELLETGTTPGTVAVAEYTWSGWAEPIPRVSAFRDAFEAAYGRLPLGDEQRAYDVVRLLGMVLADTGGATGTEALRRLERVKGRVFSSMPIRLNPDDHTFYDDYFLGMYAVAGPDEPVEPWMEGLTPWRPLMRAFSYDQEFTVILERDRGPFFPNWAKPAPSPKYWWSRLGIVTRRGDPLH